MSMMTDTRFEDLAAAHGAAIDLWPLEERAAAKALLETSPAAKAALEAELALDAALDGWVAPQPSAALMSRILGDAADVSAARQVIETPAPRVADAEEPGLLSRLFGGWGFRPAGAMAACLAVGFVAGLSGAPAPMDASQDIALEQEDNAVIAAFFGEDTESDPFDLEIL